MHWRCWRWQRPRCHEGLNAAGVLPAHADIRDILEVVIRCHRQLDAARATERHGARGRAGAIPKAELRLAAAGGGVQQARLEATGALRSEQALQQAAGRRDAVRSGSSSGAGGRGGEPEQQRAHHDHGRQQQRGAAARFVNIFNFAPI